LPNASRFVRFVFFVALVPFVDFVATAQQEKTFPAPAVGVSSAGLRQTIANYWQWRLADRPELATSAGKSEHDDRWTDWSKGARERRRAARQEFLQQVVYVSPGNLTAAEHLNADLLEYELRTTLEVEPWVELVERVSQSDGLHNEVFAVIDQMPARSVRDYENILARLRALPTYVDQSIELLREQLGAGLAQPPIVVDLMIDQVVAQASASADQSPLLAALRSFPPDIGASDQNRLRDASRAAYSEQFVPSWRRLESFLRDTYLKTAQQSRPEPGLSTMSDGGRAYASLIRNFTTTRMEASAIHQLGLNEVSRIEGELAKLVREAGFPGTVAEYERKLASDPAMHFSTKDEMLRSARDVLARVEPQAPRLFRRTPRMTVGVRPIPPDREASAASSYTAGTGDGTRSAWFNMNTYRPTEQTKYKIEALVLHETVPGDHLQVGLARELVGLPEFRTMFRSAAFSEGWGLYAESLGSELGVYRDRSARFGQLASELFRAVRLVVDTGIHAMGWSRDRAREYFAQHVPSQSLAEVDRYIARPGQALGYKLGELEIKRLRRKAEQALGSRFDARDFHDAVLRNGALPLDLLEPQIDAYIAAVKGAG
jgi:prolyl oligopeptidase